VAERDGIVTTVVNAGRGFGDLTLEPGSAYGFTARAVTHTHVLRVAMDDLVDAMLEHPEVALGIVRALGHRLKEANKQLEEDFRGNERRMQQGVEVERTKK